MADKLTDDELLRLHAAVRETLTGALDRQLGQRAATLKGEKRSGLRVHARTGLPCPVCGDTVREGSFADRSFQYCPGCQTGGRPPADRRDRKSTRLNSSHANISYAVFCLKKKKKLLRRA